MSTGPGTPKRKRPSECENSSPDVLTAKRSRLSFASSIGRYAANAADFFKVKARDFDASYHIVDKAKYIQKYFSPSRYQSSSESHQETGDVSPSADKGDMQSRYYPQSQSHTHGKHHYEEEFTSHYAPMRPPMVPSPRGRDHPEQRSPPYQPSSFFGRPTGLQEVSFNSTRRPIQMQPLPGPGRAMFNPGPGYQKRRMDTPPRFPNKKNSVNKSYRPVHDKMYDNRFRDRPFQGGKTFFRTINMEEKAKYAELLNQQRMGPGMAVPQTPGYFKPYNDSMNGSALFGQRTRPPQRRTPQRPWHQRPDRQSPTSERDTSMFFKKPDYIAPRIQDVTRSWPQEELTFKTPEPPIITPQRQPEEAVVDLTSDNEDDDPVVEIKPTIAQRTGSTKSPVMKENAEATIKMIRTKSPGRSPFKEIVDTCKYTSPKWMNEFSKDFECTKAARERQAQENELEVKIYEERRDDKSQQDLTNLITQKLKLAEHVPPQFIDEEEEEEEVGLPVLTAEMEEEIDNALRPRPQEQTLVEGFQMTIKRLDMVTLGGLTWLNDEVINFYLSLLKERGKMDNFPSVHNFNTFFFPKLMSQGHNGLKRWTRKIDVFSFDYIIIPVHLGMHWCLAMIDFRKKQIRYYDSMAGTNTDGLKAIRKYLEDESMDKRKIEYSTKDWKLINVKGIPQQMNGSDCGMFLCKYAEYITRDAEITFTQEDMPYFRRRMVWEILKKRLL